MDDASADMRAVPSFDIVPSSSEGVVVVDG